MKGHSPLPHSRVLGLGLNRDLQGPGFALQRSSKNAPNSSFDFHPPGKDVFAPSRSLTSKDANDACKSYLEGQ